MIWPRKKPADDCEHRLLVQIEEGGVKKVRCVYCRLLMAEGPDSFHTALLKLIEMRQKEGHGKGSS